MSANRYYTDDDQTRAVFEIFFLLVLAYFVLHEGLEMIRAHRHDPRGILAYFASPANWLDMFALSIMTGA